MLKSLGADTKTILWYNIQNKTYNSYVVNMKNNLELLVVKKGAIIKMSNILFTVMEENNGEITTCEYFGENREKAIEFLKIRTAIISQNLKNWTTTQGINNCLWEKDNQSIKIYLHEVPYNKEKK